MSKDNFNTAENQILSTEVKSDEPLFLDINTEAGKEAFTKSDFIGEHNIVPRHSTTGRSSFEDIESNISVRSPFTREHYEGFRPDEALPTTPKGILKACNNAYRTTGIIRNVIDLMGDFGSQGIYLVHPNPVQQRFYRSWFKHVNGQERSERFLNYLYRFAAVFVQRKSAKITIRDRKLLSMAIIEEDTEFESLKIKKGVIPAKYIFLDPMLIEPTDAALSQLLGVQQLSLKITESVRNLLSNHKTAKLLKDKLSPEIVKILREGGDLIPLDMEKVSAYYYKKDDWRSWADPLVYAILKDIDLMEKMKLADFAALDTAISQIRLWVLGDLEKGIIPTDVAINKLSDMLMTNAGGGGFDLIWGPGITVESLDTDLHKILGSDKYDAPLNNIYEGLGVPPTLTGSANSSGTTNNFISLKTLINRLEYGRGILRQFWSQELELVRQSMSFEKAAEVRYDRMVLSDEASEKKLLLDLWDRNLVADECILERFGESSGLELMRTRRENRQRKRGSRMVKAGPYFNAEKMHEYLKIALQKGTISPEDVDIEVQDQDKTAFKQQLNSIKERQNSGSAPATKPKGESGQGRPLNSKDTIKRKTKDSVIRTSADQIDVSDFISKISWIKQAQNDISEVVNPFVLQVYNKKTLRELSAYETESIELLKFGVLSFVEYGSKIIPETIQEIIERKPQLSKNYQVLYDKLLAKADKPNMEERRNIQAICYNIINYSSGDIQKDIVRDI